MFGHGLRFGTRIIESCKNEFHNNIETGQNAKVIIFRWGAPRSVRFAVRSRKLSKRCLTCQSVIGWVTKNLLFRAPPCFGRHVKPWVPAAFTVVSIHNPHWARLVGYGPFFLCVIHKEGLCSSSGDINRPMIMMMIIFRVKPYPTIYILILDWQKLRINKW
jgi:hypothetical protein